MAAAVIRALLATAAAATLVAAAAPVPVGRWAPYSTGAARDLGALTLTRNRATFARGTVLQLVPAGDHYRVTVRAQPRRVGRRVCGSAPPVAVTLAVSRSEVSPRTLDVGFYRGPPGPDPSFQPNLCARYSWVPAR